LEIEVDSHQLAKICQIIESLTGDEDHRSELWVCYLENKSTRNFVDRLFKLKMDEKRYEALQKNVFDIFQTADNFDINFFLSYFSEVEQLILMHIALGFKIQEIASYSGLDLPKINNVLKHIRSRDIWQNFRSCYKYNKQSL
jgi:hypothetical protein